MQDIFLCRIPKKRPQLGGAEAVWWFAVLDKRGGLGEHS